MSFVALCFLACASATVLRPSQPRPISFSTQDSGNIQVAYDYLNHTRGGGLMFGYKTGSPEMLTLNSISRFYGCNMTIHNNGTLTQPIYVQGGVWQSWDFYTTVVEQCYMAFQFQAPDFTATVQFSIGIDPPL